MSKSITSTPFFLFACFCPLFAGLGFFEEQWVPRPSPTLPEAIQTQQHSNENALRFQIDFHIKTKKVLPTHFGNNASGYTSDILKSSYAIDNLKEANISSLRLPGGNWSNQWFWDGTTPSDIKSNVWVNGFKSLAFQENGNTWISPTDSLFAFAQKIGAYAQPCVNFSYARYNTNPNPVAQAASYAADWVRDTKTKGFKAPFWEVGNENYGSWQMGYAIAQDTITGAEYGKGFNVFVDSMKAANTSIKIGAVIVEDDGSKVDGGFNFWNKGVLPEVQNKADFLAVHEYFTWNKNLNDVPVTEVLQRIDLIEQDKQQIESMVEKYTNFPKGHFPIAMTEYNMRAGFKNTSHVSDLFITMSIHEFIRNEYALVNLWDIANSHNAATENEGDHGMITRKDPDLTTGYPNPSFYAYYYSSRFIGEQFIESTPHKQNDVYLWASQFTDQNASLTIINTSDQPKNLSISLKNFKNNGSFVYYEMYADSLLSRKIYINGKTGSVRSGPENYKDIAPIKSNFQDTLYFSAKPFSANFIVVSGSTDTPTSLKSTLKQKPVGNLFNSSGQLIRKNRERHSVSEKNGKYFLQK